MKSYIAVFLVVCCILFARPATVLAEVHQHGVADAVIILQDSEIMIEFSGPAEDLLGFEHRPRNDLEKSKEIELLGRLKSIGPQLFKIPSPAGCSVSEATVHSVSSFVEPSETIDRHDHKKPQHPAKSSKHTADLKKSHDHEHEHHPDESHFDIRAEYRFRCTKLAPGTQITFGVSKEFPKIKELRVKLLSDTKQQGATIRNDRGSLEL